MKSVLMGKENGIAPLESGFDQAQALNKFESQTLAIAQRSNNDEWTSRMWSPHTVDSDSAIT